MATTTAPKAAPSAVPTKVATVTAPSPIIAPAAAKDSLSLRQHGDAGIMKTNIMKPEVPSKSPVLDGNANGHSKPHSKPGSPRKSGTLHYGGDNHGHAGLTTGYNEVTHISQPYCPNPNLPNTCKDYETKVRVIQRIPEMRKVEKTFFVKQLVHEDRLTKVRKSRVIMVDVEELVQVPVIKEVALLQKIKVFKVQEEIRTHTYEEPVIEYERRCTVKQIPRVYMEDVEVEIDVPVITEVPEVCTIQVPTGEFCEEPIEEYCTPGDFNLLCKDGRHHGHHHLKHRSESSSSSSSDSDSDDEDSHRRPKPRKLPTLINTKPPPGHDHGPKKPLSPTKTKPSVLSTAPLKPHNKSKEEHKPHDKPKEEHKAMPHDKPKEEHKAMPHDKPKEEHKPKGDPMLSHDKPKEEPKTKLPHEEPTYPDTKPKSKPLEPESKQKPHEPESKPKPMDPESKPRPLEPESKPKPLEPESKPKPHKPESKPKPHEDTKPKPHEETKPKVPAPNAPK